MSSELHPDLIPFLNSLYDQIHVTVIMPDSSKIFARDFGTDREAAAKWITHKNAEGYNAYYTVNKVREGVSQKPLKSDITAARFVHVDVDPPKDGRPWDMEENLAALAQSKLPPTMIVSSGYGLQALWRVDHATIAQTEAVNLGLIARYGGDKGTHNADRLLRVAGTTNHPNKKKRAAGRQKKIAYLSKEMQDSDCHYIIDELLAEYCSGVTVNVGKSSQEITGQIGEIDLNTSFDLDLSAGDALFKLIDEPSGIDRSADVFACACEMGRRGFSRSQIAGVLLCNLNAVSAHCLDSGNPERAARRAIDAAFAQIGDARRSSQRLANKRIGEGSDIVPDAEIFTKEEMLERFVFILDGSQVVDLRRPQFPSSLVDFRNATAGSKHAVTKPDGGKQLVPCAKVWLDDSERKSADALTFHAGAPRMTVSPAANISALNLWSPIQRDSPPADWEMRANIFVDHVIWLWGKHASAFLDWLAHIEQVPGQLPHFGWIHISRVHGKGRNWVSSVLARLWRGNVAASLDLMTIFEDTFNDRLSRCQLAIVDEINEGGNQSYRHAQKLRKIVTEEVREINPKYGRRRIEHSSTRWLFFSNHSGAIPLDDKDRRFYVVDHDGPVKEPEYYERLYGALNDPLFISSVAEFLVQLDISNFSPGRAPPITKAKAELIAFSQSPDDTTLKEVAAQWPVDVITSSELNHLLGRDALLRPAVRHALDRAEIRRLRKVRTQSGPELAYAVRNYSRWAERSADIKAEIYRVSSEQKAIALDQFEHNDGWGGL